MGHGSMIYVGCSMRGKEANAVAVAVVQPPQINAQKLWNNEINAKN